MKKILFSLFLTLALLPGVAHAQATPGVGVPGAVDVRLPAERADVSNLVQHTHTTGTTLTLTAGAAGGPQQHIYINAIEISDCEGTAVTAAAPTFITTTGINGNPQYMVGSGPATAGTCTPTPIINFATPLQNATPGTSVTFVLPSFITNQVVSVNVYYRLGY